VTLDAQTYLAEVTMDIERDVRLPEDTAALITSESLLGGKYMSLEPGAAQDMLPPGGRIQYTQAPQNLEQLLGQFIFSMQSDEGNGSENNSQ
jgi:phospholipid/cholesterol/gamma-HCH transport system substrate-binding protein